MGVLQIFVRPIANPKVSDIISAAGYKRLAERLNVPLPFSQTTLPASFSSLYLNSA
jgi:hypothetical protein